MLARAVVKEISKISRRIYLLELEEERLAKEASPGQFLHIRVSSVYAPLLRRPFSVAGVNYNNNTVQVLFAEIGEGTRLLSQLSRGAYVDCLGPLGSGFKCFSEETPAVLIAGGMGAAPLLFLANSLVQQKREVFMFYGAPSFSEMIPLQLFSTEGLNVIIATEDGSSGFHGLVTEAFQDSLQRGLKPGQVFACGARAMLKVLAEDSRQRNYHLQVSLEESMACGIGACRGCAVKVKKEQELPVPFARVCKEGPVFDAREVVW